MNTEGSFSLGRVLKSGLVAGVAFAIFEIVAAVVFSGPGAAFSPLRMTGAMVLGAQALDRGYPLIAAAGAGAAVLLTLSMVFALLFAALVPVTFATGTEIELGMAYGALVWLFGFYLIGPALGWVWFAEKTLPIVQLAAHAIGYGAVLGWFRHHAWEMAEARLDPEVHQYHALN
jgi:hypothetical protein